MKTKPIDKSRKSNRRCVNCEHYPHRSTYYTVKDVMNNPCKVNGKRVEYWNCCKSFEWSKTKQYVGDQT